jgi:hypothetical protein
MFLKLYLVITAEYLVLLLYLKKMFLRFIPFNYSGTHSFISYLKRPSVDRLEFPSQDLDYMVGCMSSEIGYSAYLLLLNCYLNCLGLCSWHFYLENFGVLEIDSITYDPSRS